jgi:hypothetical protein
MRLSVIRAFAIATVATMALAACANQSGMVPSSPYANARMSPLALKTCATKPPQYQWIFKGACQIFSVTSTGGHFSLGEYQGITVQGSMGRNNAKGTVKIALADALNKNGDVETYKGMAFPPYKANGITYVYASAVNQSTHAIRMITVRGDPVLQFTITNAKGFGSANICGAAALNFKDGKPMWEAFPVSSKVKRKTVTITKYTVATGVELPPKIPLYFAVNCYKQ